MKSEVSALCAVLGFGAAFASVPVITPGSVTLSQADNRKVTIGYDLENEAAVVTIDIQTNGVSIGAANQRGMYGDVHVKVEPGTGKKAYWHPTKSWPDQKITDGSVTAVVTAWATNAPPEFMVINLESGYSGRKDAVKYYTTLDQSPDGPLGSDVYRTSKIVLRRIPAAGVPFIMGSPTDELGRVNTANTSQETETPHLVTLTSDYYLGVYEITQGQYKRLSSSPSSFYFMKNGDVRPVENMSFNAARGESSYWPGSQGAADAYASVPDGCFLGALRKHVGNSVVVDLPTEAQWEFACRAGATTALYTGKNLTETTTCSYLDEIGRYQKNDNDGHKTEQVGNTSIDTNAATSAVGVYKPNDFGLYDMEGNVQELCLGWKAAYGGDEIDPVGIAGTGSASEYGSCRGGSYCFVASYIRCASRYFQSRNGQSRATGFRICVPLNY